MNLNQEINALGRICLPMCQRVISTDISEDFTLPDYNPEIRRVLYVRESLLPPAKFISGNKLDVNGVADYTLVYISNEGKLCSAPLSAEYGFSVSLDNIGDFEMSEGVSMMVHSVAESSNVRVSAPRRLQIRTHIRSNVNAWGKKSSAENIEQLENPDSLQCRREETVCADIICESSDIVPLSDQYNLPSEDCRVAMADSAVFIENCTIDGDVVHISGDVVLKMLVMCDNEQKSEKVIRRLPFDAQSDLDGVEVGEGCSCRASGSVTDIALNIEEGVVNIEANLMLEICVAQNCQVGYTSDMYSTEQQSELSLCEESLPFVIENKNFGFNQNEKIPLSELNFPTGAQIVDVNAYAVVDGIFDEDGKYVMRGNCKYNVILQNEGEYSCCDVIAPFAYTMDGEKKIDSFDALVQVLNCKAKNDSDMLNVEAELSLSCTALGAQKISMVDKACFLEPLEHQKGEWSVCYLRENEGLWEIAKRYGVCIEDIKGNPETDKFVVIER